MVRQRGCLDCGHKWFSVELMVPDYAVGWSTMHNNKPVLRVPLELSSGHTLLRVEPVEEKERWRREGM